MLTRGIRRGELHSDADLALLVDQLVGPLYYRVLITGDPISPMYASDLVEAALSIAGPQSGGGT